MTMTDFVSKRFTNKDGIEFETRPHFATFNDKHNASKAKALIVLYHRAFKLTQTSGLTLGELHKKSGINYNYLKTRLAQWVEWGYIQRHMAMGKYRPVFVYAIADRGKHFIEDILPPGWLSQYVAEIKNAKGGIREAGS